MELLIWILNILKFARNVARQANGQIVVTGYQDLPQNTYDDEHIRVARYNTDYHA